MRILSKLMLATFAVSLPVFVQACKSGNDDEGSGGMGGNDDGSGGRSSADGGSGPGTGGRSSTGGAGGEGGMGGDGAGGSTTGTCAAPSTAFSVADCNATTGPAESVRCFDAAGAFAGDPDWTQGWTNWSTNSSGVPDVRNYTDLESIDEDTELDASVNYRLPQDTVVYVHPGATLTIPPGTVIRGAPGSSLIVQRGGKIQAVGTKDEPILFTSTAAEGEKDRRQWGGLIILGRAQNFNGSLLIEGVEDVPENYHGGDDDEDSSGELKYVRIEFGGIDIGNGNEINGLTLGSIGSGTKISYVQINTSQDDGFEWFGGKADADHLVVNNVGDDMFDADKGFRGKLTYLFGRHIATLSEDPNGWEVDGDRGADVEKDDVETIVNAENVTLCGTGTAGSFISYGAVLRRNMAGSFSSHVIVGFDAMWDPRDQNAANVHFTDSFEWSNIDGVGYDETEPAGACEEPFCDDDFGFDEIADFEDELTNASR